MPAVSAVEHVQQWAQEQQKKRQKPQQMRAMLRKEKEASDHQEANQDQSASRSEKATFRLWLLVYVVMVRHAVPFSTICISRNMIETLIHVRDSMITMCPSRDSARTGSLQTQYRQAVLRYLISIKDFDSVLENKSRQLCYLHGYDP